MNPLYIIDFSNWCFKCRAVHSSLSIDVLNSKIHTGVLYGMYSALKKLPYNDICIVLDGTPLTSQKLLPSYKGTRNHDSDDEVWVPKSEVIKFLTAVGPLIGKNVSVVCQPLHETDEVIASLVYQIVGDLPKRSSFITSMNSHPVENDARLRYLISNSFLCKAYDPIGYDSVVIASTDADFVQLQRYPNVYIDKSMSGTNISNSHTSKSTEETSPCASIIYKAIYGDSSDNIPPIGVPMPRQHIMTYLRESVTSIDVVFSIRSQVENGTCTLVPPSCRQQFLTNFGVAFLEFRGLPSQISYTGYTSDDALSTLTRYSIRID